MVNRTGIGVDLDPPLDLSAYDHVGFWLYSAVGTLGTTSYEQLTCLVTSQVHAVAADSPVSVTVFGYSSLSSFAYAGGAGLAPIKP